CRSGRRSSLDPRELDEVPERVLAEEARTADDGRGVTGRRAGRLEPAPQLAQVALDDQAEVRAFGRLLVHEAQVQLQVASGPVPDEPRGIEGREHATLLEAEEAAVERTRPLGPLPGDRDRHVLESQAPRAAYTSSYARTASFACCASASAAPSILAATESMKR